MTFKYRIVISKAHLPIIYNVIIDNVKFVCVGMHVERFDVAIHENRAFFMSLVADG